MLSIGRAAQLLGVTVQTLRNWDKNGQFKPDEITKGGMRRYSIKSLRTLSTKSGKRDEKICKTIAYARVISNDYKADLKEQMVVALGNEAPQEEPVKPMPKEPSLFDRLEEFIIDI